MDPLFEILEQIGRLYPPGPAPRIWWRGQAVSGWHLHPAIYHRNLASEETTMVGRFHQLAPSISQSLKNMEEGIDWLFIMQHHGLPTRLLDWTESPLVALFFSVFEPNYLTSDGILYALDPSELNEVEFGQRTVFGVGCSEIKPIVARSLGHEGSARSDKIAAINAQRFDPRHVAQHAQCTIHGRSDPLESLGSLESKIIKIVIPAGSKLRIRRWLEVFQLNQQTLFPDLDSLSQYIKRCAESRV